MLRTVSILDKTRPQYNDVNYCFMEGNGTLNKYILYSGGRFC